MLFSGNEFINDTDHMNINLFTSGDPLLVGREDGNAVGTQHCAQDPGVLISGTDSKQAFTIINHVYPQKLHASDLFCDCLLQGCPDKRLNNPLMTHHFQKRAVPALQR